MTKHALVARSALGALVVMLAIFGWRLVRNANARTRVERKLAASLEAPFSTALAPAIDCLLPASSSRRQRL